MEIRFCAPSVQQQVTQGQDLWKIAHVMLVVTAEVTRATNARVDGTKVMLAMSANVQVSAHQIPHRVLERARCSIASARMSLGM